MNRDVRAKREIVLRKYDIGSLRVAYKVTMKRPLTHDLGDLSAEYMINAILNAEFPNCDPPRQSR
jgi:hypothetical protein